MSDEQTAAAIVADAMNACDETAMEAAIVRALQAARTPPAGHIIDDAGEVRKVLGTLPVTADGCVIGTNATVFGLWTPQYSDGETSVTCSKTSGVVCAPHACWSTRKAAEAAKEAQ